MGADRHLVHLRPPGPHPQTHLPHLGFDETRDPSTWTAGDLALAADIRGGALVSETATTTNTATPLRWRCAEEHTFTASPRLVLTAGHWCPTCVTQPHDYARQAESNAFLRQVT